MCVCVCVRWPAATRLHVHCPTAGEEVRWVGLSGKWAQWGAARLVELSSSEGVQDHQLWSPVFSSLFTCRDSQAVVFLTEANNTVVTHRLLEARIILSCKASQQQLRERNPILQGSALL